MAIELHTWNTPNGRKISVALEEMGLPYTVHPVNIGKGEQFNPDFLKISPNNRIPAIIDPEGPGGKPISVFESGAILIYLGGQDRASSIRRTCARQVPVLEWLMWQMGGFGPMPGQVHHFLQVENEQDRRYGLERYIEGDAPAVWRARQAAGRPGLRRRRVLDRRFRHPGLGLAA